MSETQRLKHAVVLSGGGADGAYEVGVMKALFNGKALSRFIGGPVEPDIFTGTSIGAFNAALLVSQWDKYGTAAVATLETVWRETMADRRERTGNGGYRFRLNPLDFLDPRNYTPNPFQPMLQLAQDGLAVSWEGLKRFVGLVQSSAPLTDRILELFDLTAFVSRDPLEQTVRETIQMENIRRSQKRLIIAATNWDSGELKLYTNDQMSDTLGPRAILASAAIPGFYPPTAVGAQPYVDGGVVLNTPMLPAVDAEADILHVIYMDPDVSSIPQADLGSTLQTMYRMQVIGWARLINREVDHDQTLNRAARILERIDPQVSKSIEDFFADRDPESKFAHRLARPPERREIDIHRYHPSENFGGLLGFLNTDRDRIARLIDQGFDDTVHHDCAKAGCVLRGDPLLPGRPETVPQLGLQVLQG
jgi:predicted acylesterase/phospholipase RssA